MHYQLSRNMDVLTYNHLQKPPTSLNSRFVFQRSNILLIWRICPLKQRNRISIMIDNRVQVISSCRLLWQCISYSNFTLQFTCFLLAWMSPTTCTLSLKKRVIVSWHSCSWTGCGILVWTKRHTASALLLNLVYIQLIGPNALWMGTHMNHEAWSFENLRNSKNRFCSKFQVEVPFELWRQVQVVVRLSIVGANHDISALLGLILSKWAIFGTGPMVFHSRPPFSTEDLILDISPIQIRCVI